MLIYNLARVESRSQPSMETRLPSNTKTVRPHALFHRGPPGRKEDGPSPTRLDALRDEGAKAEYRHKGHDVCIYIYVCMCIHTGKSVFVHVCKYVSICKYVKM